MQSLMLLNRWEESTPSLPPVYPVKWASHEHTYAGHLNCVKPIFAMKTIMCSFVRFGRPEKKKKKNPLRLFTGMLVPWEKLNQRSHSCSVVPSVDKGWAVQCGRTVSLFSTDGCMPGPQFDNPVEGYGLCLRLGSRSKAKQWAPIFFARVCVLVCAIVHVCMCWWS